MDAKRSNQAFQLLIQDWQGILASNGHGLYRSWVNDRWPGSDRCSITPFPVNAYGLQDLGRLITQLFYRDVPGPPTLGATAGSSRAQSRLALSS